jgi:hypothetical protein
MVGFKLHFSEGLTPEERTKIQEGYKDFSDVYDAYIKQANDEDTKGNGKLLKILTVTNWLLPHICNATHVERLIGLRDVWDKFPKIEQALIVRIKEAMIEPESLEYKEPEITFDNGFSIVEEEAPETQRSLVARLLGFSNIFVKTAKGNK